MVPSVLEMLNKHVFPTPPFVFFPLSAGRLTDGSKEGEMREQKGGGGKADPLSGPRGRVNPRSHVASPRFGSRGTCFPRNVSQEKSSARIGESPKPLSGRPTLILIHAQF